MRMIAGPMLLVAIAVALSPWLRGIAEETGGEPKKEDGGLGFDRSAPPKPRIKLTPALTFGARAEVESAAREDVGFGIARPDNTASVESRLSLALSFDPNKHVQVFTSLTLFEELAWEGPSNSQSTSFKPELAFLYLKEIGGGFSLEVGRQRFVDDRRWLYDRNLDAVRLLYHFSTFALELSASRRGFVNADIVQREADDRVNNYLLYCRQEFSPKLKVAGYVLARYNELASDVLPVFYGLRANGRIASGWEYWLDLAQVRGKEQSRTLAGTGLDVGTSYQFWDLPLEPCVALGFAFGSGDRNPNGRTDRRFRQTGFQENATNIGGLPYLKYYGELLSPELSNLAIFTSGIGLKTSEKSGLAFLYHYYLQDQESDVLHNTRLTASPTGLNRHLGSEVDLVFSYEEIRNTEMALKLGYFIPSRAFPTNSDNAFSVLFDVAINF